jgi:hypothetical protein
MKLKGMQASRASQEAPGFKLFYQANISLRRDSLAKRLTLTSLAGEDDL